MSALKRPGSKTCLKCGKAFEPKKCWATYCSSACKDAFRRQAEDIGRRFRERLGEFSAVSSRLEKIVALVAARQPLLGELVAEVAALHADMGKLLGYVAGDQSGRDS